MTELVSKSPIAGLGIDDWFVFALDADVNVIRGTDGNETINGSDGDDLIRDFGGNDRVYALGGSDTIKGGSTLPFGVDFYFGGEGDDVIFAGTGETRIWGDDGNDRIYGGVPGQEGVEYPVSQVFNGGAGDDRIVSNGHSDWLYGGDGNDRLISRGIGKDGLDGGSGNDRLYGSSGNSIMRGGDGNDRIYGGDGHDLIYGGKGRDRIYAGSGADQVWIDNRQRDEIHLGQNDGFSDRVYIKSIGVDLSLERATTVHDFEIGIDKVDIDINLDKSVAGKQWTTFSSTGPEVYSHWFEEYEDGTLFAYDKTGDGVADAYVKFVGTYGMDGDDIW